MAAVLEAHSTLSTEYRLRTTMCYWLAGSVYAVLEDIFRGARSIPTANVRKKGKLGFITGYKFIKEEEEKDPSSVVSAVRQLEGKDQKALPDNVIEAEMKKIPTFAELKAKSEARRQEVYKSLLKVSMTFTDTIVMAWSDRT